MKLSSCLIEQWPIDMLDCGGLQIEERDRCLHRIIHAREKNQAQTFLAWQPRNFKLRQKNCRQCSLATGQNLVEILWRAQKTRESISRPALDQARRPSFRHFRALFAQKSFYLGAFRFERAVLRADFSIRPSARTISVASTWSAVV